MLTDTPALPRLQGDLVESRVQNGASSQQGTPRSVIPAESNPLLGAGDDAQETLELALDDGPLKAAPKFAYVTLLTR